MVSLIKNDLVKIEILKQYRKKNISYTASHLSNYIEAKYETIKKALEFLAIIGIIEIEKKEHGMKDYIYYNLSNIGKEILNQL